MVSFPCRNDYLPNEVWVTDWFSLREKTNLWRLIEMRCKLCKRELGSQMDSKFCGFCEKIRTDVLGEIEAQLAGV